MKVEIKDSVYSTIGFVNQLSSYNQEDSLVLGVFVNIIKTNEGNDVNQQIINNIKYVFKNDLFKGEQLYLNKQNRYKIISYYPYVESHKIIDGIIEYPHGTDIMWASNTFPSEDFLNKIPLNYSHLTTQTQFSIIDTRDPVSKYRYPIEGMKFEITGFPKSCKLNINDGTVQRGIVDPTIIINQQNVPLCFVASPDATNLYIKITIPARAPYYTGNQIISSSFLYRFLPGHSYDLALNMSINSIDVNVNIIDWSPIDTGDLTM